MKVIAIPFYITRLSLWQKSESVVKEITNIYYKHNFDYVTMHETMAKGGEEEAY